MHGIIHKAARGFAMETFGAEAWAAILAERGLPSEHFIDAKAYDDGATMRLLGAVARRAGLSAEDAPEGFGRRWVEFAQSSAYALLLERAGADLLAFPENLDRMRARIKSTMADASPPSFGVEAADAIGIEVRHASERAGLAPFARGILCGLVERFGEDAEVTQRKSATGALSVIARRAA